MVIRVNGDIENNQKYKKIMDRYLASPVFSQRCKELKEAIKDSEKKKQIKLENEKIIKKPETINMFLSN